MLQTCPAFISIGVQVVKLFQFRCTHDRGPVWVLEPGLRGRLLRSCWAGNPEHQTEKNGRGKFTVGPYSTQFSPLNSIQSYEGIETASCQRPKKFLYIGLVWEDPGLCRIADRAICARLYSDTMHMCYSVISQDPYGTHQLLSTDCKTQGMMGIICLSPDRRAYWFRNCLNTCVRPMMTP